MQPVEDFIRELIEAKTTIERARYASYLAFRDQFFAPGCEGFSSERFFKSCEAEKIDAIQTSDSTTIVTTSTEYGGLFPRFRYHVQPRGEGWVVVMVEVYCPICNGTGTVRNRACNMCKGAGWTLMRSA